MEVSRNRSWRPPANATTFSFGPWVTCHCAHGAVEEPEMRIHADEDVRRAPSQKLRMKTEDVRPSEFSLKKPPLQLPEAAIPEREERRNGREVLSKATAATSALKRVQLPVDPPAPVRSGCKKVMIASLVFIVIGGLVLLAGGYPVAEHLANDLKEHNCKLSSPDVHEASLGEIPYVQYSLTPGVSCWVQLEIETPCQGSAPCWSPSPLQHAGWTLMTFEDPKEFLSPRSTCNTRVKELPEHFKCFFASTEGAQTLGVLTKAVPAWEVETLVISRYIFAVLAWILASLLLCVLFRARCLPSKSLIQRFLRLTLKVCAVLVATAVLGAVLFAMRYSAAKHLQEDLQDGTCHLRSGDRDGLKSHWSLLPAAQCSVSITQGDAIAESMVFAFPDKFWDKQYHHLNCDDLVKSLDKSFPCAKSGKIIFFGKKADLHAAFLELVGLQSENPAALDFWCFSVFATLVMPLFVCFRWSFRRKPQDPEAYRQLPGDAR